MVMRKLISLFGIGLLFLLPGRTAAQTYGEWAVPCDGALPPRFSAPFHHGVIYEGKEFLTSWRSVSAVRPLPPVNWYEATPKPHPVSVDGTSQWDNAGVLVHCWVERNPYFITHHRDPIGYRGTVRPRTTACGEGGGVPVLDAGYDPYDPAGEGDCSDSGTGDGGDIAGSGTQFEPGDYTGGETVDWATGVGNGGVSVCGAAALVDFVCIDEWVDGEGWVEWDCGYVTTC